MKKEILKSGTGDNIQPVPYESIKDMPISLRVVAMYAMLVTKEYLNLSTFSSGEKSTAKYEGWGVIGYYEKVCSILGMKKENFDNVIMQGIQNANYDMSYVINLLNRLEFITTSVIDWKYDKSHQKNHYIKGMTITLEMDEIKSSGPTLSKIDVPYSTILLKKGIDVDYCLKELYSILPKEVVNALQDREAIKLVLGNQTEAKRPEIVANYQSIIGVQKPNTLIHQVK